MFKNLIFALFLLAVACGEKTTENTQKDTTTQSTPNNPTPADDKTKRVSPPDSVSAMIDEMAVNIIYSRPSVRGRKVWGELVPFGEVWRTGANEATVFSINKNATIAGKTLKAGKYALFTIPNEDGNWTLIFNSDADQWGAFDYKQSLDVLRVPALKTNMDNEHEEMLKFSTEPNGVITIKWEKMKFAFAVKPSK